MTVAAYAGEVQQPASGVKAAGLAVFAADTGRLLMLQRSLHEGGPTAGTWEFPGGKLEDGEDPFVAAKREWSEETGCDLPAGVQVGRWHFGVYCGFVWRVGEEADVPVFDGRDRVSNPDDPDGDRIEALAWWDPAQLTGSNPSLRDELRQSVSRVLAAFADLARAGAGGRLRMAGVLDELGHLHSPLDGRFIPKVDVPDLDLDPLDKLDNIRVFGGREAAGRHVVAFDDPDGVYVKGGGRGVALRDVELMGEIRRPDDIEESTVIPVSDVDTISAALDRMTEIALDHDADGDGLSLLGSEEVAGFHVAALHDTNGVVGPAGETLVALSYRPGGESPWSDIAGNSGDFEAFYADEVDDLTAALRGAAAAQPKRKQGLDRKVDKLRLDGRIELADGELLTASGRATSEYSDHDALMAVTDGPDGPRMRFGIPNTEYGRDWEADENDDGDTVVLDAAGLDAIDAAMAQARPAAVADRHRVDAIYNETEAKVDELQDQLDAIRPEVESRELTPDEQAQIADLNTRFDKLRSTTPEVDEFYKLHRRRTEITRQLTEFDADGRPVGLKAPTPEQELEEDQLFERIQELAGHPDVQRAEALLDQAFEIDHGQYVHLPLTPQQQAERSRIEEQIRALHQASPNSDDKIASGVIPGQWGSLVWEVHGTDDWEDGPEMAWRVKFGIGPEDAGPDWEISDRDDDVAFDLRPSDIDRFLRELRRVASTGGFPAPAASRAAQPNERMRRDVTFESLHPRDPNSGHFIDKQAVSGFAQWLRKKYRGAGNLRMSASRRGIHVTFDYKGHPVQVLLSYLDLASFAIGLGAGGFGAGARAAIVAGKVGRAVKLAKAAKLAKGAATGAGLAATLTPQRAANVLAVSIVDALVGGTYTPQQLHTRAEWLNGSRVEPGFSRGEWRQLRRGDYYNIRWPRGSKVGGKGVGGRFMAVGAALEDWMNGFGEEDPLEKFDRPKLKAAATALDVKVPPRATKQKLKELLRAKAIADVRAQREENLATAGTGRGTPFTPPVGTRRDLPGGYMVREPSPGGKGEAGHWSLDGTKWIPDDKTPGDVWAVHKDNGELVGHVSVPSEARALLDRARASGRPAGTRVNLDGGAYADWDGAAWQVHLPKENRGGKAFDVELAGSASSLEEAKALAAKGLAERPPAGDTKFRPSGGPVTPPYTGPKMVEKTKGRKLSVKERIELAVANGDISVDTARRLLGDRTVPAQVHSADAIDMAAQITDLANSGDEERLRKFLGRQNTSTLRGAARVLGLKTGSTAHTEVVNAIAGHLLKGTAAKPERPSADALARELLGLKDYEGARRRLESLNLSDADAVALAKELHVPGTGRMKTRVAAFAAIAKKFSPNPPQRFDPTLVAEEIAKLPDQHAVSDRLAALTKAQLQRIVKEFGMVLPLEAKDRAAIRDAIVAALVRDRDRWRLRTGGASAWARFDVDQPRIPAGLHGGGEWVDAGKIFDAAGNLLGFTDEKVYREHGLTVHSVDFGEDGDLRVALHEGEEVVFSVPTRRRGGRQISHVTDRESSKDLAEKIRWAEEQYSELDEEYISEIQEKRGNKSPESAADLEEFDRTEDGSIVGYDPVEEGVVVLFPKDGVDEPREDHLDEDFNFWVLHDDDATDMAYALDEVADFDAEQADSYSAGSRWDLYRWTDHDISVSDDGGESWAATLSRHAAEQMLDQLIDLRESGEAATAGATRKTGLHTITAAADGSITIDDRWGKNHVFTIPAGDLDKMIDALDEATYDARLDGGYDTDWDADTERAGRGHTRAGDHYLTQPRDPGGKGGGQWVTGPISLDRLVEKLGEIAEWEDVEGGRVVSAHDGGRVVLARTADDDHRLVLTDLSPDDARSLADQLEEAVSYADDHADDDDAEPNFYDMDTSTDALADGTYVRYLPSEFEDRRIEVMLPGHDDPGDGEPFDRDSGFHLAEVLRAMADSAEDAADEREAREQEERDAQEEREREEREAAERWWEDVRVEAGRNTVMMDDADTVELSDVAHGWAGTTVPMGEVPALAEAIREMLRQDERLPRFEGVDEDGDDVDPDIEDEVEVSDRLTLQLWQDGEMTLVTSDPDVAWDINIWKSSAGELAAALNEVHAQWVNAPKPEPSQRAALLAVSIVDAVLGGSYTSEQQQAREAWLRMPVATRPRRPRVNTPRPGAGVPFKLNETGQWVDRYGQFADLPDVPKPAKAAKAAKTAPRPATAKKVDVPSAIGRLESLRQDLPSDASEQTRQILAGLAGPQLKQVADHFGVELHGRLIADKRQSLERDLLGVRLDHKAIMDWRVAEDLVQAPGKAGLPPRMTLKEARRQTFLDAVHGHADLADAEFGELYQDLREKVESGKWAKVQARWAALQAEKRLLKQSGAAIQRKDGEEADRLSKLAGRYAKLAEDIQISDSVTKTDKYTNPRSTDEPLRPDGAGTLAQVPADRVPGDEGPGGVLPAAGPGDRVPGRRPRRRPGAAGADGSAVSGADGTDDGRPVTGGEGSAGGDAAEGGGRRDRQVDAPVFRPHGQEDLAPATEKQRLAANLEALRTLRTVQAEDRPATTDEQATLARWSGWGSLPGVFKEPPPDKTYAAAQETLRTLLNPAEYAAARRTTRNAHYTDAGYVSAIWDAMEALGFDGGEVLEPGSGSGTFMGLVPDNIAPDTHVTGVELDPITAAIAQALYPNQDVRTESFADTRVADGTFDAAIGNVPFSDTKLVDREYNPGRAHNMHNHFIIKSLRMTRPGGLVAVITSRYTMDSLSPTARQDMAKLGDLVGAVRLPSGAHSKAAGTAVVTDLLIFRRRKTGTPYAGLPFEQTRPITVDGKDIPINELFVDEAGKPTDMVLGQLGAIHGMRGKDDLTVTGDKDAEPALRQALGKVVRDAKLKALTQTPGHSPRPEFAATGRDRKPDGYLSVSAEGKFTRLVGGVERAHKVPTTQADELRQLLQLRDTVMALVDAEASSVNDTDQMKLLREDLNRIYDGYVAKYGPVSRFTETQAKGSGDDDVEEEKLTRKRPPQGGFRSDPFSAAVRSLEIYDPVTGTARKADIFERRGISPRTAKTAADNPADALAMTLDEVGEVDLEHIADLLGLDDQQAGRDALGTLVYDEPGSGRLVPRAEYLSGNVRKKLETARIAAAEDPLFEPNVEALQRVLPTDLTPAEIRAKMGAGWIQPRYVQEFLREILRDPTLTVRRKHGTSWQVKSDRKDSTAATTEWGIRERNAVELAGDILSQRPIKVSLDDFPDQAKTEAAQAKAKEIADRFEQWAWEDPTRQKELLETYNRVFNSRVLRSFDGVELALPGLSRENFYAYPHRYAAVARIVNQPSAGLWHEVGAGKTSEMIIGAMELRRLGLIQKPAIVVPNHTLEQMTREFLERYPQARVLAIGADDLKNDPKGEKRREIIARAATGDWDAVIVTQGAFKRIPVSTDTEKAYLEAEAEPLRRSVERRRAEVAREVRDANPDANAQEFAALLAKAVESDPTVKELEGLVEKAEQRVKEHLEETSRDPGLTFEQTGIDYLFVDEAHLYKNLRTPSRVPGMGIPGSQIATDLHMKLHYLRSNHDRVVTLATATPIANSVSEAYTMLRYLAPDELQEMGIETFDEFAAMFGELVSRLEVAPTGGLRQHSRFARFVNIPELMRLWLQVGDVKTADDLKGIVKTPDLAERVDADGRRSRTPEIVVVPPSEELKGLMLELVDRAKHIPYPPEKGGDNMLRITGEGRAAALDLRMVGRSTKEPTKLDVAAERIAGIYSENKERVYTDRDGNPVGTPGALQLVFSDIGTPSGGKKKPTKKAAPGEEVSTEDAANTSLANFNAYESLRDKLVARGVPRQKIRFIHDANTDVEKAELFAAARDGRIAILIGSTNKMGVGTNVQDRAIALHHLDAPWRPADVQQREGRIIRQGNKNPEVQVIRYVTEQSFDAYIWQAITTKGTFINQIMKGRLDVREMEDVGDFALSAGEVTALGTGNRWLIEHAEASADLTRLERALHNHEADQRNIAKQITAGEAHITTAEKVIADVDKAIAKRVDTRGDSFSMFLANSDYTDRAEAQDKLRQILGRVARGQDMDSAIGEFGGFPLYANATGSGWVEVGLRGVPGAAFNYSASDMQNADVVGRLQGALGQLERVRSRNVAEIGETRQDLESLRGRVGKPFRDTDALQSARERFERVGTQLKAELEKRGQTMEPEDPAAKAAARQAAAVAEIRSRLDAGDGFKGIGEVTTWVESQPELVNEIPSNAGAKWGVLSPGGQLVVQKGSGGGYDVTIPRVMISLRPMTELRTQKDAKRFAEILESSGIPWNTGIDFKTWVAPDGASAPELVARLRGEHRDLDPKGVWKTAAVKAEITRRTPERLREPLLAGQYRSDNLGVGSFARLEPQQREEVLAILQGSSDPDADPATVKRLREYGLAEGRPYEAWRFAFSAALRIERDYHQRVPQPLDPVRKRFQNDFNRIQYNLREATQIHQILADADADGNLRGAARRLRTLADELEADRYGSYSSRTVTDVAKSLADVLEHRAAPPLRDDESMVFTILGGGLEPEERTSLTLADARALLAAQGLSTDGDLETLLARLRAAGISTQVPAPVLAGARTVPAGQARMLLSAFDCVGDREPSFEDIVRYARAAGADTHPGGEQLHLYWTKDPEGLAKWADLPEGRWTALYNHLKHHMNPEMAKRVASAWFIEVFGYAAGSDINRVVSGKPPRGEKIGPG